MHGVFSEGRRMTQLPAATAATTGSMASRNG